MKTDDFSKLLLACGTTLYAGLGSSLVSVNKAPGGWYVRTFCGSLLLLCLMDTSGG
jgi:hypothetical protein